MELWRTFVFLVLERAFKKCCSSVLGQAFRFGIYCAFWLWLLVVYVVGGLFLEVVESELFNRCGSGRMSGIAGVSNILCYDSNYDQKSLT